MKVIAQSGLEYIPRWNKNHKEPEETQIKIIWNYLSGSDREKVFGIGPIKISTEGEVKDDYTFKIDNETLLKKSIKAINNLEVAEGETTRQATMEDIYNLPELGNLYRELVNFFMDQNREENKKKL